MSDFFKKLTNIDNTVKFYKYISFFSISLFFLGIFALTIINNVRIDKERNYIYAITSEGIVISLERFNKMEKREVEARGHIRLLLMYLFDIDKFNYKEKLKSALPLGNNQTDNNSVLKFYQQQEKNGFYREIEQYNGRLSLVITELSSEKKDDNYFVYSTFKVFYRSDITTQLYNCNITFRLIESNTERNDKNSNAFFVADYVVEDFKPVSDQ